ncbi:MAG: type II toxin-antitoxin system VapC family toxin [Solirubrobacteraceae bacterium]
MRALTLLVDTGVLLAAADRSDPDHAVSRDLLESHRGPLITTELVLAETGWLLDRQLGPTAEAALYGSVADGELVVEHLSAPDWLRVAELTAKYADQRLGGVDSGLVAVAERLGLTTIATLDHRHFGVVRPNHVEFFTLVP